MVCFDFKETTVSLALYVCLEKDLPGFGTWYVSGKSLAHAQPELDRIAKKLGLDALESFVSADPEELASILEDAGVPAEDLQDMPKEKWYLAAKGLKSIRGLLKFLKENPGKLRGTKANVTRDLQDTEKVLVAASKQKVRFHFAWDG